MAKGKPQVAKKTQNNKKAAVAPAKPSSIVANKKNGVQKKPQQQQKKQQPKKQQKISKRVEEEEEDFDINDEDLMGEDELNRQLMEASSDEEIEGSDDDSDALPDSYEGEKVVGNKNASKKRVLNKKQVSSDSDSEEEEEPQRKKQKKTNNTAPLFAANDSDSEDEEENPSDFFGFGDSSDEDEAQDDEYLSKVEQDADAIDQEKQRIEQEAEEELLENAKEQEEVTLLQQYHQEEEDAENEQDDEALNVHGFGEDVTKVHQRIMENIRVLSNFSEFREEGFTRADYLKLLGNDLSSYYGYSPEIVDMFLSMFSVPEVVQLLEANEAPRPITIRSNQLKTRRRELAQNLINRGINLDPIDKWTKVGLKIIDAKVPLGATPEYLAGHYMLQGASSFLPVMALNPKQGEKILDMAAAPGGKTTYIGECMKNTGCLFANDFSKERSAALVANIHRMGVRNAIVFNYDGRDLPQILPLMMDRVLLDAPCTGLGVVSRDPSIKLNKTKEDFEMCSKLQKELILSAIDCVDAESETGGIIVYSTCSISVEENEDVVAYALKKRHVEIVDSGLPFGNDGFTKVHGKTFCPQMTMAKRFYPHAHNMDGFFVCKLKKLKNGPKENGKVSASKSLSNVQKQKAKDAAKKKEQKLKNIAEQKEKEDKNKKLFQEALKQTGGNVEAAKQIMEDRKKEILSGRKKFRTTKRKEKWRPIGRFAKQSGQNMV